MVARLSPIISIRSMVEPDIDGVLVGGASLEVGSFKRLVQFNPEKERILS